MKHFIEKNKTQLIQFAAVALIAFFAGTIYQEVQMAKQHPGRFRLRKVASVAMRVFQVFLLFGDESSPTPDDFPNYEASPLVGDEYNRTGPTPMIADHPSYTTSQDGKEFMDNGDGW